MGQQDEDDDDDDGFDAGSFGETSTGYHPALDLAWAIVSNDPDGKQTPNKLHKSAVECMIRAMDAFEAD